MVAPDSLSDPASRQPSSAVVNARAARRVERRMLIDGRFMEPPPAQLSTTSSLRRAKLLGSTNAANHQDMELAIGAVRAEFNGTAWSTDTALRRRCLSQLHEELDGVREHLRDELIAEAGVPVMTTQSPNRTDRSPRRCTIDLARQGLELHC